MTLRWSPDYGLDQCRSVWFIYSGFLRGGALRRRHRWNEVLPGLYEQGSVTTTSGIGLHFATGGIILLLGSIQLVDNIRLRFPTWHRWIGRIYVISSLLAALGGLLFILLKGTIGGLVMDLGFGLYGVLMLVAAIETYRHAVALRFEKHRAWALRLYALAIGSWFIPHGLWFLATVDRRLGAYPAVHRRL
ncbi:DUF2306 domain-containing protein [Adhaeribacter arboris]|uniref:DUF2306 domain-containing protein n=1 Tax=Adhaeribacter arboris TaxID=2072846 RepID=UPI0018ECF88D|nr:DUF2306 domain-containing protein [Adhaeribacter arboris]